MIDLIDKPLGNGLLNSSSELSQLWLNPNREHGSADALLQIVWRPVLLLLALGNDTNSIWASIHKEDAVLSV